MDKQGFIKQIAGYVQKYAASYGIMVHSAPIAQAILESGWGESKLAAVYHNYFGLKCGTKWTGKSVNLSTMEEYEPGTLTQIKDNFRVYDSMEEGVKGYFEFIQLSRYQNLRGITDPETYLKTIKADGYATSSSYVDNTMRIVTQYDLTQYDMKGAGSMAKLASAVLAQARAWIGRNEAAGSHKEIIDVYNGHKPLARGYKVKYTDAWCATFVSAVAIKCGLTSIIPTECGCGQMIALFQALGEWQESDSRTPNPGDVIFYDWDDTGAGDNTGWPDHVGIVESVSGGKLTVIEGNKNDAVGRRALAVNGRYIRGYGVPKYDAESAGSAQTTATKSVAEVAREVIAGKWGNGEERKSRLTAAGYDYQAVQKQVNALLKGTDAATKSVAELAREVIAGKWGNGEERKSRLTAAGYDYKAVQTKVNELLA
jgi:hypothetical protein